MPSPNIFGVLFYMRQQGIKKIDFKTRKIIVLKI